MDPKKYLDTWHYLPTRLIEWETEGASQRHMLAKRRVHRSPCALQVLVLGSIDAELRRDAQLEGSQLRFLAQSPQLAAAFAKLGLEELEVGSFSSFAFCARLLDCFAAMDVLYSLPQHDQYHKDRLTQ